MKSITASLLVLISLALTSIAHADTSDMPLSWYPDTGFTCEADGKSCQQRVYDALLNAGCEPFEFTQCQVWGNGMERCYYKTKNCRSSRLGGVIAAWECTSVYPNEVNPRDYDETLSAHGDKNMFGQIKAGFFCRK